MGVRKWKGAIHERDIVTDEEVLAFLRWNGWVGGILGVAGDVDAVEGDFAVLRVAKGCTGDAEAMGCHRPSEAWKEEG